MSAAYFFCFFNSRTDVGLKMAETFHLLFVVLVSVWPILECNSNVESLPSLRNGHRHRQGLSSATATSVWAEGLLTNRDRQSVAALNQREDEFGQQNLYDRLQVIYSKLLFLLVNFCHVIFEKRKLIMKLALLLQNRVYYYL